MIDDWRIEIGSLVFAFLLGVTGACWAYRVYKAVSSMFRKTFVYPTVWSRLFDYIRINSTVFEIKFSTMYDVE